MTFPKMMFQCEVEQVGAIHWRFHTWVEERYCKLGNHLRFKDDKDGLWYKIIDIYYPGKSEDTLDIEANQYRNTRKASDV